MIPYSPVYSKDYEVRQEFLRIAAAFVALANGRLEVSFKEPEKPRIGIVTICDGVYWNPLGNGVQQPVWYDGASWQALGGGHDPLSYFRQV